MQVSKNLRSHVSLQVSRKLHDHAALLWEAVVKKNIICSLGIFLCPLFSIDFSNSVWKN